MPMKAKKFPLFNLSNLHSTSFQIDRCIGWIESVVFQTFPRHETCEVAELRADPETRPGVPHGSLDRACNVYWTGAQFFSFPNVLGGINVFPNFRFEDCLYRGPVRIYRSPILSLGSL